MPIFVCAECGYRFESERGRKCPYCAGERIEKDKLAKELVDDVRIE